MTVAVESKRGHVLPVAFELGVGVYLRVSAGLLSHKSLPDVLRCNMYRPMTTDVVI